MKRLTIILITFIVSINVTSQIRKGISPFRFEPDMYLGANIGPNIFFGEGIGQYLLDGSIGFSESLFIGYNFSEIIGSRILGTFGKMSWPLQETLGSKQFSTMSMNAEALLNVTNVFSYYNLKRPLDFVLFGGLGIISREKASYQNEFIGLLIKGGAQLNYRINYDIELNAKLTGNIVNDKFNENVSGIFFDAFPEFNIGLTYHLRD